jgi:hypothetical protein
MAYSPAGRDSIGGALKDKEKVRIIKNIETLKRNLKPGDVVLMKPSSDYKYDNGSNSIADNFIAERGVFGKVRRLFNREDEWGHVGIWSGDQEGKAASLPLSSKQIPIEDARGLKTASLNPTPILSSIIKMAAVTHPYPDIKCRRS